MKKLLTTPLIILVYGALSTAGFAQKASIQYDTIVCYSSDINENTRIIAPKKRTQLRLENSIFNVDYQGFTPEAEVAFQYAVEIWQSLISSPVTINVTAIWEALPEDNVLGNAIWGRIKPDLEQGLPDTFYPIALAEKIVGEALNDDTEPDIIARFNSNANWYLATDGNTPEGLTDFVTVVLHELGHGIGISDSFRENNDMDEGTWGPLGNVSPIVYDRFVINGIGQIRVEKFQKNSGGLHDQLTSNSLFFNSPIARAINDGDNPKLYAPFSFSGGSSIAHLNEATYPAGDLNSLMTPNIGKMEAIHDPGPLTMSILAEMGWVHTYIDHTPLPNTEELDVDASIVASITSDTDLQADMLKLFYSTDEFESDINEIILNDGGNSEFSATITAPGTSQEYHYYIEAVDNYDRVYREPASEYHSFKYLTDSEAPVIELDVPDYIFATDDSVIIATIITDDFDLVSTQISYRFNEDSPVELALEQDIDQPNRYFTIIDLRTIELVDGDSLHFTIQATDGSTAANIGISPAEGENSIPVRFFGEPVTSYINDFNTPSNDFIGDKFSIYRPSGFVDAAIHSEHPYQDGMDENGESNYTYMLLNPITIREEQAFIEFDEIVLIEPGEVGTVFGDEQFWDYVIVEGSNDSGDTWENLINGYDSRDNSQWFSHYSDGISGNDSNSSGSNSLYFKRKIDMLALGKFEVGENIHIRFRLFADPAAHGWGWSIDNLAIQDEIVAIEPILIPSVDTYPNPVRDDMLTLKFSHTSQRTIELTIVNILGAVVDRISIDPVDGKALLDVHHLEAGQYILNFLSGNEMFRTRIIIEQ